MGLLKFFNEHAEASNRAQFVQQFLSRQPSVPVGPNSRDLSKETGKEEEPWTWLEAIDHSVSLGDSHAIYIYI
jgi:hypothetical protein